MDEFVVKPSIAIGDAVIDLLETAVLRIEVYQSVIRSEHHHPRRVFDHATYATIRFAVVGLVAGKRQSRKFELIELAGIAGNPDVAERILAHRTDARNGLAR